MIEVNLFTIETEFSMLLRSILYLSRSARTRAIIPKSLIKKVSEVKHANLNLHLERSRL